MAGKFAATTEVPVARTQGEIEALLEKYGATAFARAWIEGQAAINFELAGRRMRMLLPLPDANDREFRRGSQGQQLTAQQQRARYEQALRTRWRALLLVIRAKLESVECGILTMEEAWLPHIVLPSGQTVAEWTGPQLERVYATGEMPALLPGLGQRALGAGDH